jgi:squalene synthase HpnC
VSADLASGKGHRDENFPVASFLIAPRHRAVVMAFYRVARLADDIADHPAASPAEKLARLDAIEASLTGANDAVAQAVELRSALAEGGLSRQHALDLLTAFRRDVTKTRYADWAELMDYCRYSAAPVGRFVLDVHGEDQALWPANDALCAALQVINHLQDCAEDYRELDRVYVPEDHLAAARTTVSALAEARASPALRAVIVALAERTARLLDEAAPFAGRVRDARLAAEVGAIHALARSLQQRLLSHDPLSQVVHHRPWEAGLIAAGGVARTFVARLGLSAKSQSGAIGVR